MCMCLQAEVCCSFITTTVGEQHPRSHCKGATGRGPTGDQQYPALCHCQLGQDIPRNGNPGLIINDLSV